MVDAGSILYIKKKSSRWRPAFATVRRGTITKRLRRTCFCQCARRSRSTVERRARSPGMHG